MLDACIENMLGSAHRLRHGVLLTKGHRNSQSIETKPNNILKREVHSTLGHRHGENKLRVKKIARASLSLNKPYPYTLIQLIAIRPPYK
jgi:hypothetical protein